MGRSETDVVAELAREKHGIEKDVVVILAREVTLYVPRLLSKGTKASEV